MNPVSEEIKSYLEFDPNDPASCLHYGVKRRSGRYPWGSGKEPYQHSGDFLSRVEELEKKGMSQTKIAEELGMTTTDFRVQKSLAKEERRKVLVAKAEDLRAKGYSLNEIARQMGYDNDSSVRSLLNDKSKERMMQAKATADYLKEICDDKGIIDVGKGSEKMAGCSEQQMEKALYILQTQGYEVYGGGIPQATNKGQQTTGKFLCPPGTEYKEIYNFDNVHLIDESNYILTDGGQEKRRAFEYPTSLDPKRLQVVYGDQGGDAKDGLIELRRGVEDISLGKDHYSQVRILVDGTHYIKGMARYADDLPDGIDVRFNTNKPTGTPILGDDKLNTVLKPIKKDPNNPFGSAIKERGGQRYYDDPNGKFETKDGTKQSLSIINKTKEEGDVASWSKKLPSQFLGKQSDKLIKQQLDLTKANYISDYDEISNLTNPTVKKKLLESFARECASAAEHLQAAALPRAQYEVILPLTDIKDDEVYAPNYRHGEKVALVRFPHEGTSQIPILTVNNKSKEGLRVIGSDAKDAVGITKKVADQLSGADFDGDTVMVIPTGGKNKIVAKPQFEGLIGFDPKIEYGPNSPGSAGTNYRKMRNTQTEMGKISNLITDMTLKGASEKELTKAMRHSMTVIDAEKHGLDYKRSEIENDIPTLKKIYQGRIDKDGKYREGASTLLSRAKGETSVLKRQGSPKINEDGTLTWKTADDLTYIDKKTGKVKTRTQQSTQMREAKDAMELVSDLRTRQELAYADYANFMKDLEKKAYKQYLATEEIKYSPTSAKTYATQVNSLNAKLELAERNRPLERKANMIAKTRVDAQKKDNPSMSKAEIKKANQLAIEDARYMVGAKRTPIEVTEKEWECIQAGGISPTKLKKILNFMNDSQIKELATPRNQKGLSQAKINKIQQMRTSGYTLSEIADDLGVSTSTISKYIN